MNTPNKNPTAQSMREEYTARINRVIDYIEKHLDQEHALDTLGNVACFLCFIFTGYSRRLWGEP